MPRSERTVWQSPCGPIQLCVRDGRLSRVRLLDAASARRRGRARPSARMRRFVGAVRRCLAGEPAGLTADELDLSGATPFQREVYEALCRVPFGRVVTYGELAARAGRPGAARAVGQAMGCNPLPVVIPCHRVVESGGGLGGFGAGPGWKRRLLRHEGWQVTEGRVVKNASRDAAAKTCVYAGSFDPPTSGHMYMIEKGAELFERLIVAVGVNPKKAYSFTVAERLEMLRACCREMANVEVDSFEGQFLVHYAHWRGAGYVLRGVRSEEDYRFEHAMRNVNEDLEPGVTTVFLIPPREICEVSSSFVKGLVGYEGWEEVVRPYVPEPVYEKLLARKIRWTEQSAGAEGAAD